MINLDLWLDKYITAVDSAFGSRIVFTGIQGSYARSEAHGGSDIDVVLILDKLTLNDLTVYKNAIAGLEERAKICGFVGGADELKAWNRGELFQFYHDTKAIYGDLEFIAHLITEQDVKYALVSAACGIYHACAHNFVHENDPALLHNLFKTAGFALQAKYWLQTGAYISKKKDLAAKLSGSDLEVLTCLLNRQITQPGSENFANQSGLLLEWAAQIIKEYGGDERAETED